MNKYIRYAIIIILSLLLVYLISTNSILKEVSKTAFIAFVVAYSLKPVQGKMMEKGIGKKLSSIILLLAVLLGVVLLFAFLIPSVIKEALNLGATFDEMEGFMQNVSRGIENLSNNKYLKNVTKIALNKCETLASTFFSNLFDGVFKKTGNIFSLAVIPILVYYILADGELLSKSLIFLIPLKNRRIIRKLCRDINVILSKYILSQFLLSALISAMTFTVLIILDIDFPLMLSLLNGIFNIVPYFGPLLGSLPSVIIALLDSPKKAIWAALLLNLIQQIEGDIIAPKITGDTVDIHPLFIILLLIAGGKIGGFVGMVMAVPIAVIVKVIIEDLDYYMYS
ncbi:MAG: AI-2E family transporter [Clostridia bacterium]|jgi:predicted PurR-regulated permease PerM|nr:AI-2E family transporter [Clostridia bacterium]